MGTYIALSIEPLYQHLWKQAENHLRVIAGFDAGLTIRPVQPSTKTLLGFGLRELTYVPTALNSEGRKLLHAVINLVSTFSDVLISPLLDMYEYADPSDVAVIKQHVPWVDQTLTHYFLSTFGGGFTTQRIDPVAGNIWSVEYDAGKSPKYEGPALEGPGFVELTRPEILFHELAHVQMDGDPLPSPSTGSLSYEFKEGVTILRENGFRLSNNPRLKATQLRSTTDLIVRFTY